MDFYYLFIYFKQCMEKKKHSNVSDRIKNRKNIQERVVSCSLYKRLRKSLMINVVYY